jgi:AcrR family transcriptional regulator
MSSDKKDRILQATVFLLENTEDLKDVTTRVIAGNANVNPALINYYFGSKEELMICAMKRILFGFLPIDKIRYESGDPRKVLEETLISFVDKMIIFRKHLKDAIPDILMKDEITLSAKIYPLIKEYHGDRVTDQCAKIMAYQIMSFMLLVFYRSDEVKRYSGLDFTDEPQRIYFVKREIDLILQTV